MSTDYTDAESEAIVAAGVSAAERVREQIKLIEQAKESQPERLAKARAAADEARGWSVIEEPWDRYTTDLPLSGGDPIALPNLTAKETFGARLAFDILDCGDDFDRIEEVQTRYFQMVHGDTGLMFLLAMSALSTISSAVVPQLLDDLEQHGSNYDARVMLAQARQKAWAARVNDLKDLHLGTNVKPVDGFDIGTTALGDEGVF